MRAGESDNFGFSILDFGFGVYRPQSAITNPQSNMSLNLERITNQMAANAKAIEALLRGVSDAQASWQPDDAAWSLLIVICHLFDEEREDYRRRVEYTLHRPSEEWLPIDPQGWVFSREYHSRDFREMLSAWLAERAQSLEWLATLRDADWDYAGDW
jgi:hypothetical protein